jgi:hypothetical protein
MNSSLLLNLADAFGEIARGCKKIRQVCLELAQNNSAPSEAPSESVQSESVQSESVVSESESESEQPCVQIDSQNFEEEAVNYLYSKKMVWGPSAPTRYFEDCIDTRLRGNRMKMVWMHCGGSKNNKKNWKKISTKQAEQIYSNIRRGWEIINKKLSQKTRPKQIRTSRWERRDRVKCDFPEFLFQRKGFKDVLVSIHEELPSMK